MTLEDVIHLDRPHARNAIDACEDETVLSALYRDASEQHADISDDLDSYFRAGTAEQDWCRRAGGRLAQLARIKRWTEHRMLRLELMPPYNPTDPRVKTIRVLERKLKTLKAAMREAGVPIPGEEVASE